MQKQGLSHVSARRTSNESPINNKEFNRPRPAIYLPSIPPPCGTVGSPTVIEQPASTSNKMANPK